MEERTIEKVPLLLAELTLLLVGDWAEIRIEALLGESAVFSGSLADANLPCG
jgi:hypothetical protein